MSTVYQSLFRDTHVQTTNCFTMKWFQFLSVFIFINYVGTKKVIEDHVWTWNCVNNQCQKSRVEPGNPNNPTSLAACKVTCEPFGTLWPQPTGTVTLSGDLIVINPDTIELYDNSQSDPELFNLIKAAFDRFVANVKLDHSSAKNADAATLSVTVYVIDPTQTHLTLATNESYEVSVGQNANFVNALITAQSYFGLRHGLETLNQLIIYDDIRENFQIPNDIFIKDEPKYPYRGVMLDTGRNYISVNTIKRTIHGMSASKLNSLHWHMTDSQSFPFVSKSNPVLSQLGAYSPKQVYTAEDVQEIVEFGREHGVRVMPEFDAPAHVGEGWQDTDFVTCFNSQPWGSYCKEPPCGQFDPTKPQLYDALEGLYKDMLQQFKPDLFHMGGDEVSLSCWSASPNIVQWMTNQGWSTDEEGYMKLWNFFQSQALERLDRHSEEKIPIIMWDSTLTKKQYVEEYLPKDRYIIQVWTHVNDPQITDLLEKGYKLILSNYDVLYLDCGFASWVGEGTNWCAPYKGWQEIYDNSPTRFGNPDQFLGAEAPLWTEEVDDTAVDGRIWPRAAAMAERLWAEPNHNWEAATNRMLIHRERLVKRGIAAEAMQPKWCHQNAGNCV